MAGEHSWKVAAILIISPREVLVNASVVCSLSRLLDPSLAARLRMTEFLRLYNVCCCRCLALFYVAGGASSQLPVRASLRQDTTIINYSAVATHTQ